jgi:hypothetical protein
MTNKERKVEKGGERKMERVCFCIPARPPCPPHPKLGTGVSLTEYVTLSLYN